MGDNTAQMMTILDVIKPLNLVVIKKAKVKPIEFDFCKRIHIFYF